MVISPITETTGISSSEEGRKIIWNEERIKLGKKTPHTGLIPKVVPFA